MIRNILEVKIPRESAQQCKLVHPKIPKIHCSSRLEPVPFTDCGMVT